MAAVNAIKPLVTSPVWSMIQFMLFTGCRPSEAVALKWSESATTLTWICHEPKRTPCSLDDAEAGSAGRQPAKGLFASDNNRPVSDAPMACLAPAG